METSDVLLFCVMFIFAGLGYVFLRFRRDLELRRIFKERIGIGDRVFSAKVLEVVDCDNCQQIWCRVKLDGHHVRFYFFSGDTFLPDSFKKGQRLIVSASSYNPATQQADIITVVPSKRSKA